MLAPSHQQDLIGQAYLKAVVASAGLRLQVGPYPDDDSIDFTLSDRGPRGGRITSPKLDVQLKTRRASFEGDIHSYPLKLKNYNDLRETNVHVPRILILVLLPSEAADWITQTHDQLGMRHCAYWLSLRGFAETTNEETVTVIFKREQMFSSSALMAIFERIRCGELP